MNRGKSHDLGIRTLINGSSALCIAFLIFFAHYPALRWLFAIAVCCVGAVAIREYSSLLRKKGISSSAVFSITCVVLYILSVFVQTQWPWSYLPEMVLALTFFSCFIYFAIAQLPPITHIATTFFGIIYIAVPLGLFVSIMYLFKAKEIEGSWWIIYLIAVTKSADIGGYFIGNAFGKRKLALKLSPNKTLEGALGGLMASIIMSIGICYLGKRFGDVFTPFSYGQSIGLGILIAIVGQMGDLAESFLKRDAGVKDSSSLPGVGGVLDMIDSLLFTAPVVYLFLRMIYTT